MLFSSVLSTTWILWAMFCFLGMLLCILPVFLGYQMISSTDSTALKNHLLLIWGSDELFGLRLRFVAQHVDGVPLEIQALERFVIICWR